MRIESGIMPHLVVLEPDRDRGRRIPLNGDYMIVGREPGCDVRFEDPHVSRTHAALEQRGHAVCVLDLGSAGGTFVNEAPVRAAHELHAGDVLRFASVSARLESGTAVPAGTATMAAIPAGAPARYDIGRQDGEVISNVGRDQYNSYIQHVTQQRENFLREAAAAKTKARWLVWTGFLAFVVGFGLFAAADLNFIKEVSHAVQSGDPGQVAASPFGREIGGVPIGLAGWALGALGILLSAVGIVLHIVATSRRRRVYRDLPLPPQEQGAGQMRRAA